jgi:ABC-type proline/glycine betaine transport system ATPase subunit
LREALVLADRIALIDSGKLVALHTPSDFQRSENELVRSYLNAFGENGALTAPRENVSR